MLSTFNSNKFKFWSFVSMVFLVFVHGHNLEIRTLQPDTIPGEALTFTSFTEYLFANGLLRFRIPMLFVISGYLYALYDQKPNSERIQKRLRTLLLPYGLWVALYFIAFYLAEMIPSARQAIANSHVAWAGTDPAVLVHDYKWYTFILRTFFPLPYQFWFIRDLFIFNLLYPVIRYFVTTKGWSAAFFSIALLGWFSPFGWIFWGGESLLFFALGVYLQKSTFDLDKPGFWLKPLPWAIVFIGVASFKTWLAFSGVSHFGHQDKIEDALLLLHKLTIISGLIAAWFGLNKIVEWCMSRTWFVWLTGFSFMIYALHAPLVAIAIDPFFNLLQHQYGYRMMTFILLPISIIIGSIVVGATLRAIAPRVYGVLTGGRGLV